MASIIQCSSKNAKISSLKTSLFITVPDLSYNAQVILTNDRCRIVNVLFDHCLRNTKNGPSRLAELLGIFSVLESQQNMQRASYTLSIAPFISPTFRKTIGFVDEIFSLGTLS
ncbi:Protein CBG27371 [Caenorhabditis briggsae]|uniref:Protein CBG27371 n=1 Tax=Caenorhabditis briggsae TaxID=6238 RepID=B6IGH1_CAEBR|nr:Protein CBG27371 [Caenorhabditis briggsae]CAR99001.1 Protein CBG27371 [Caenorhabditis briggsae]